MAFALGLPDDEIDRLLAEAEARLSSNGSSEAGPVVAVPAKTAAVVAATDAPTAGEQQTAASEESLKPEKTEKTEELSVRVPQLPKKQKVCPLSVSPYAPYSCSMMKSNPKTYDAGKIPSWDSSWHHNDFLFLFIVTLTGHTLSSHTIFPLHSHASLGPLADQKMQGPKDTLGPDWFNMPRTNLTPELKRDLQALRMRDVAALGKQFFKKDSRKPLVPEYCQVGTIIAGATDGQNNRLTRKERKRSIVEEILASDNVKKLKSKYDDIQKHKRSGKKEFYKKLVAGRRRRKG